MEAKHEAYLRAQAGRGQEMALQMVRSLSSALVYPEAGNVATNEKLWDVYASEWSASGSWVRDMAAGTRAAGPLECVGDEWAPRSHTERVVDEWLGPLLGADVVAAEVGSGGGRIARLVAPRVRRLHCFDVSAKMLAKARQALEPLFPNVDFHHVHGDADRDQEGVFSDAAPLAYRTAHRAAFDVVYCFDVMVHMDLHAAFACLKRLRALLRESPRARAFVSTANLLSPNGWARFQKQSRASVGGFVFMSPETARKLFHEAGFDVLRERGAGTAAAPAPSPGEGDDRNVYYDRDYLALLKPRLVAQAPPPPLPTPEDGPPPEPDHCTDDAPWADGLARPTN